MSVNVHVVEVQDADPTVAGPDNGVSVAPPDDTVDVPTPAVASPPATVAPPLTTPVLPLITRMPVVLPVVVAVDADCDETSGIGPVDDGIGIACAARIDGGAGAAAP
jgi:hypothetical protein